jgi:hypothetical protein
MTRSVTSLRAPEKVIMIPVRLLAICLTFFILFGCNDVGQSIISPGNSGQQIAEGRVVYFEGGGTVELQFPAGFRLDSCAWITASPDSSLFPYLRGAVDKSCVGRFVQVYGTTSVDTVSGMFASRATFVILYVDSLKILR